MGSFIRWPARLVSLFACALLGSAAAASGESQIDGEIVAGPLGARIDLDFTRLVPFGFSGAAVVEKEGGILLAKGYGMAEESSGIANTADTLFPIDSLSKQFTAAAVLKLEMQGVLSTDDPLEDYFENLAPDKRGITLHQLLSHTSGLVSGETTRIEDSTRGGVLAAVFDAPLLFPPGTRDAYSNLGYSVLAAVVEIASGQGFDAFLRESLFEPAGMRSTGLRFDDLGDRIAAHRYAHGTDQGTQLDEPALDWNHVGGGGLHSTAMDLLRWHQALSTDEILSREALEKLHTPVANDYAYGWIVESTESGLLVHHDGGSSKGSACEMRRYIDAGVTLVLLCNRDGEEMLFGNRLVERFARLALGEELEPPPAVVPFDERQLQSVVGAYDVDPDGRIDAVLDSGRLVFRGRGQAAIDALLSAGSAGAARSVNDGAEQRMKSVHESDPASRPDWIAERVTAAEASLGPWLGHEVLGTTPDWVSGFADWMTFVELDLERGTQLFRIHWKAERILATGGAGIPEPAEVWFAPGSDEGCYEGFHLPTGQRPKLQLTHDAHGQVAGFEFGDGARAQRRP